MPQIDHDECTGCGMCQAACPADAIVDNGNGLLEIDQDICVDCEACIPECPEAAINN